MPIDIAEAYYSIYYSDVNVTEVRRAVHSVDWERSMLSSWLSADLQPVDADCIRNEWTNAHCVLLCKPHAHAWPDAYAVSYL